VPDYCRVEGIVEPVGLVAVHAESDGFVTDFLPSDRIVSSGRDFLVKAVNPDLEAEKKSLLAELRGLEVRQRIAETREIAAVQILAEQIEALNEKIARVDFELSSLHLQPVLSGTWISPDIDKSRGVFLRRGQQVGFLADLDNVHIRATAGQELAAMIVEQAFRDVQIRVRGRPDVEFTGEIEKVFPAGQEVLPSEALGYRVGGSMPTLPQDSRGLKAAEKFFEIRIRPSPERAVHLLTGQRVVTRIRMPSKPLAVQWWRSLRQLFQRRFHI
jgi:putative peptide zinc metalloprotease protein